MGRGHIGNVHQGARQHIGGLNQGATALQNKVGKKGRLADARQQSIQA